MQVYPAILSDSLDVVARQLSEAQALPEIETVHIDVIDGIFADNLTVAPLDLVEFNFAELSLDFHIMAEEPLDYVLELVAVKDVMPVRALIGQIERMSNQSFFVEEVQKQGWKAGLALDLFTPVEEIDEAAWNNLDIVLLMAVEAGYQGQQFHPTVLDKVAELRTLAQQKNRELEIIIDGGVSDEVIKMIHDAGATSVAIGSSLWCAKEPEELVAAAQKLEKKVI